MTYIKKGTSRILIQNYRYDVAFNIVTKIIMFINSIITVRVLGLGRFGTLAFLGSIPLLMSIFITQGNAAGLSRFIPEYKEKSPHLIQVSVNRAIVHNLIYSIIIITMFLAFKGHILGFFNLKDVSSAVMIIILANTFFMVMEEPVLTFLRVNYDNLFINLAILTQNLLTIAGFYTLFFAGLISITTLLLLAVVAQLVRFLLCALRYRKLTPTDYSLNMPEDEIKEVRKYSGKMFFFSLLTFLTSQRGAIYFIQIFLGPSSVGIFRLLQRIVESIKDISIPKSVNLASTSSAVERFNKEGLGGLRDFMHKFFVLSYAGGFVVSMLLLANISWIMRLYNLEYHRHFAFIVLFLCCYICSSLRNSFHKYIIVFKKNSYLILSRAVAFVISFLCYIFFLRHGLWMAPAILIVSTLIEYSVYHLAITKCCRDYAPNKQLLKLSLCLGTLLMTICFLVANNINYIYVNLFLFLLLLPLSLNTRLINRNMRKIIYDIAIKSPKSFFENP